VTTFEGCAEPPIDQRDILSLRLRRHGMACINARSDTFGDEPKVESISIPKESSTSAVADDKIGEMD
jgi:hypothetical protein